jgi:hypothetical protein
VAVLEQRRHCIGCFGMQRARSSKQQGIKSEKFDEIGFKSLLTISV